MRKIVILGSTGSIGRQALEIVSAHPDKFEVIALAAGGHSYQELAEQANRYKVPIVGAVANGEKVSQLCRAKVIDGLGASSEIAAISSDLVLNAITGSIGLGATLSALSNGNKVALANKESLVAGGELVTQWGRENIFPVDSEHSALAQALLAGSVSEVRKLILTASGGPFRERSDLAEVTIQDALAHPTWSMGPVVTINSATLVNKGLEIIEAHHLFGIGYDKIEAVVHPQSVIHSMVEFIDGSTIAQASPPSMKGPIGYALNQGERLDSVMNPIDWSKSHTWNFSPIDNVKFPAVELALRAGRLGTAATAMYNAANEEAVAAFLAGRISFTEIVDTVEKVVIKGEKNNFTPIRDLADVTAIEQDARLMANELLSR